MPRSRTDACSAATNRSSPSSPPSTPPGTLPSVGRTSPTVRGTDRSERATALGRQPYSSATRSTRSRVPSATPGRPLRVYETTATETPAARATSAIVGRLVTLPVGSKATYHSAHGRRRRVRVRWEVGMTTPAGLGARLAPEPAGRRPDAGAGDPPRTIGVLAPFVGGFYFGGVLSGAARAA